MSPEVREEAIAELVVIAIAWRIARSGALSWHEAKERALVLYPEDEVGPHTGLADIKHIAERAASEIIVGEEHEPTREEV